MNPALHRGIRKAIRTLLQLAAGGALTGLVSAIAGGLPPATQGLIMAAWTTMVAFAQNTAETAGKIPTLLPTPGLVPSVAAVVATTLGTVETTVDQVGAAVGDVTGVVTNTTGELMGEVSGTTGETSEGA